MLTYIRVMGKCGETFRSFHIRFLPSVLFLLAILLVFVRTDAPFFGLSEDFPPTLLRVRASLGEACFWVGSRGATPPLRGLCYLDLPHVGLGVVLPLLTSLCLAPRYALRNLIHIWKKSSHGCGRPSKLGRDSS